MSSRSHLTRSLCRCIRRPSLKYPQNFLICPKIPPAAIQWQRPYASISAAELQFGQPVYETHPHILKSGELTPGISALEYNDRRANLAAQLPDRGIAILAASELKYKSGVVFYEFHQDPDFFYLTGFNEPGAIAVIQKTGHNDHIFHLFVRPKNSKAEQWEGPRTGLQGALDLFNADESGDVSDVQKPLSQLIAQAAEVYTDISATSTPLRHTSIMGFRSLLKGTRTKSLRPLICDLRVLKSEAEVANMRLCGKISGRAITKAMGQKFTKEKDLAAFLDYQFRIGGCDTSAYVPVIAGGKNALSIHYVQNNGRLHDADMVLVDAGGEYGGYITDITRTWPISGKFTSAQRDLYNAVLTAQRDCIKLCRANANVSLDDINLISEDLLMENLGQIGFDMSRDAMATLFPHHVGHYIGLDVHDSQGCPRSRVLKTGHCITIEPGIYVPNDERWPIHFRGIGIRIEDSVCIQDESPLVLTTEAVKEVVDIEEIAAGRN
ncbi:MAG: hypothetical protein M1829_005047 [Trizodia sp. TS-e1964]|nr:MAG: hypothetical protein M1829_005047 [Trizodia sp. TS-e1964]